MNTTASAMAAAADCRAAILLFHFERTLTGPSESTSRPTERSRHPLSIAALGPRRQSPLRNETGNPWHRSNMRLLTCAKSWPTAAELGRENILRPFPPPWN